MQKEEFQTLHKKFKSLQKQCYIRWTFPIGHFASLQVNFWFNSIRQQTAADFTKANIYVTCFNNQSGFSSVHLGRQNGTSKRKNISISVRGLRGPKKWSDYLLIFSKHPSRVFGEKLIHLTIFPIKEYIGINFKNGCRSLKKQ